MATQKRTLAYAYAWGSIDNVRMHLKKGWGYFRLQSVVVEVAAAVTLSDLQPANLASRALKSRNSLLAFWSRDGIITLFPSYAFYCFPAIDCLKSV